MNPRNSNLLYIIIILCFCLSKTFGHLRLSEPKPRGQYLVPPKPIFLENEPVNGADSSFICRNDPITNQLFNVVAGNNLNVKIDFAALHVGDCFFYLSYDQDSDINKKWFKIAQIAECEKLSGQIIPISIPAELPSCDHCTLRFEQYSLHLWPSNVEFYCQCVDISIQESNSQQTKSIGFPIVSIPGHLPTSNFGQFYRDPFSGTTPFFFTGPPLANFTISIDPTLPSATTTAQIPLPDPNLQDIESKVLGVGEIIGISTGVCFLIALIIFIVLKVLQKFKPEWYAVLFKFIGKKETKQNQNQNMV